MKRLSTLLLIGLVLPACAPSAEWGPGLMHWSDRDPKMTHSMAVSADLDTNEATDDVDNAMVGTATESDVMQESDVVEDADTDTE